MSLAANNENEEAQIDVDNSLNHIDVKRRRRCKQSTMRSSYIDYCVCTLITVFVADLALRLYKLLREYICYQKHYLPEHQLLDIIKRAFSYRQSACIVICICICAIFWRWQSNSYCFTNTLPIFLTFAPLYWLFDAASLSSSNLDYAIWVRENHGLDYAAGMASNYFHGYLKLTLPSNTEHNGIRERIELYESQHKVKFAVNRLIILVPNTLYTNAKIQSRMLEKVTALETVIKDRAGTARPFKNDVYRFTREHNGSFYYVVMEGATPMASFYEAMKCELSATWQMREMQREIWLKFYQHLKKLTTEWPETRDEVELVLYNTYTEDGRLQDVGEVVWAHICNLWQEGRA